MTQALAPKSGESKPADQPVVIARRASLSKPTPKPRPRSQVTEQGTEKQTKVEEATGRPTAPPRAKAKPSRKESEAGAEGNSAVKDPKSEPAHPRDLQTPPPMRPKPKASHAENSMQKKMSPNAVVSTNPFFNEDPDESDVQDPDPNHENTEGTSTDGPRVEGTKKAPPPPVRPKPKASYAEDSMQKEMSPNAVVSTNPFLNEDPEESDVQDPDSNHENTKGTSKDGPRVEGTKKAAPPPVPRRVDLE